MRVLGIDPGSQVTGWGVLDDGGGKPEVAGYGVIRCGQGPMPDRLARLFRGLLGVIRQNAPEAAAVEAVFHSRNARSALVLGQARGVALLAAGLEGLEVSEYAARTVKQTVTGDGAADKAQVQKMLGLLLGSSPAQADAADALAVALCHLRFCVAAGAGARK